MKRTNLGPELEAIMKKEKGGMLSLKTLGGETRREITFD